MIGKILELWNSFPSWIKWPLAIIVIPNLIILSILFFTLFIPWHHASIMATITPIEERRELQIQNLVQVQTLQYEGVKGTLQRIEQHQAIMYQALLNKN